MYNELESALRWLIIGAAGYYLARICLALALIAASRVRPGWRRLALAAAPSALRPLLRRATAGGLLTLAVSTAAAQAAQPAASACEQQLPLLDRVPGCQQAVASAAAEPEPSPPRHPETTSAADTYTVQAGDSLWLIAQRILGPASSDSDIAATWPLVWEANRATIGQDPDLIMPGMVLALPSGLVGGQR